MVLFLWIPLVAAAVLALCYLAEQTQELASSFDAVAFDSPRRTRTRPIVSQFERPRLPF